MPKKTRTRRTRTSQPRLISVTYRDKKDFHIRTNSFVHLDSALRRLTKDLGSGAYTGAHSAVLTNGKGSKKSVMVFVREGKSSVRQVQGPSPIPFRTAEDLRAEAEENYDKTKMLAAHPLGLGEVKPTSDGHIVRAKSLVENALRGRISEFPPAPVVDFETAHVLQRTLVRVGGVITGMIAEILPTTGPTPQFAYVPFATDLNARPLVGSVEALRDIVQTYHFGVNRRQKIG